MIKSKLFKIGAGLAATVSALGTAGAGIGIANAADTPAGTGYPTKATSTLTATPPTLGSAPSIDFASNPVSAEAATYTSKSVLNPLTVTNLGNLYGWSVGVTASDFAAADGATLSGATFTLKSGKLTSTGEETAAEMPTAAASVTLSPASSVVLSAAPSKATAPVGLGEFSEGYDGTEASLAVPAGAVVADGYTSNLVWTLTDGATAATTPSTTPAA